MAPRSRTDTRVPAHDVPPADEVRMERLKWRFVHWTDRYWCRRLPQIPPIAVRPTPGAVDRLSIPASIVRAVRDDGRPVHVLGNRRETMASKIRLSDGRELTVALDGKRVVEELAKVSQRERDVHAVQHAQPLPGLGESLSTSRRSRTAPTSTDAAVRPFWNIAIEPLLEALRPIAYSRSGSTRASRPSCSSDTSRDRGRSSRRSIRTRRVDTDAWERDHPGSDPFPPRARASRSSQDLEPVDAALVDGDHNWYTVRNELELSSGPRSRAKRRHRSSRFTTPLALRAAGSVLRGRRRSPRSTDNLTVAAASSVAATEARRRRLQPSSRSRVEEGGEAQRRPYRDRGLHG